MNTNRLPYEVREGAPVNLWERLKSVGEVLAVCIGIVGLIGVMQTRDLTVKLEVQRGLAARYRAMQTACINDKFYRNSYICQKALAP